MTVAIDGPHLKAPRRPALRVYGGKWSIAPWIISFMPPHRAYLEPCIFGASVFLQTPPREVEILNDLNGRVVNFFRQLRDNKAELIRRINLTPWAEDEYKFCKSPSDDPTEDARRFYVTSWQSIHGAGDAKSGWRWLADPDGRGGVSPSVDWITHDLDRVSERLRRAHIMNRDALAVIQRMLKINSCLIYFDPPYLTKKRTRQNGYSEFEVTKDWHVEAAGLLRQHTGYVLVSGYQSDLYTALYEAHGWQRHDKEFQGNSGSIRTESLWLNPATVAALERESAAAREAAELAAMPLFARVNGNGNGVSHE
jgi:DNA adenine methylase